MNLNDFRSFCSASPEIIRAKVPYRQVDKSLTEHLGTHVKSTLPHDVWMVSNECLYFKIVDINKIKRAPIGANNKKVKGGRIIFL